MCKGTSVLIYEIDFAHKLSLVFLDFLYGQEKGTEFLKQKLLLRIGKQFYSFYNPNTKTISVSSVFSEVRTCELRLAINNLNGWMNILSPAGNSGGLQLKSPLGDKPSSLKLRQLHCT
jgi:hypothetical protein